MTAHSLATKLAAVPQRAMDAIPSLPARRWRSRRSFSAGETLAAIGLGLAVGIAIGLLLPARSADGWEAGSVPGETPGQYT
jgi:hypothetical protein